MDKEKHKQRHIELHCKVDELVADWITHTGYRPSEHTVMELLQWAYEQTKNPTTIIAFEPLTDNPWRTTWEEDCRLEQPYYFCPKCKQQLPNDPEDLA